MFNQSQLRTSTHWIDPPSQCSRHSHLLEVWLHQLTKHARFHKKKGNAKKHKRETSLLIEKDHQSPEGTHFRSRSLWGYKSNDGTVCWTGWGGIAAKPKTRWKISHTHRHIRHNRRSSSEPVHHHGHGQAWMKHFLPPSDFFKYGVYLTHIYTDLIYEQ